MNIFMDKEYHPIIEDYITDYVDDDMGLVEREAFEEVLVHDDDLRELAFSAKEGKKLLAQFREIKAKEGFMKRLFESMKSSD
jgi:hypothetical protein